MHEKVKSPFRFPEGMEIARVPHWTEFPLFYCSHSMERMPNDWMDELKYYHMQGKSLLCGWCVSPVNVTPLEMTYNFDNFLYECDGCGFWEVRCTCINDFDDHRKSRCYRAYSTLRDYEIENIDRFIPFLVKELKKYPDRLSQIKPIQFEQLVAEVLYDYWQPCEVKIVGGTSDGGVDLILIMGEKEEHLVQIKHRQSNKKGEGPKVVRELCGVLLGQGRTKGVVVTTAPHFTPGAKKAATIKTEPPIGDVYEMTLVDGKEFSAMLNNYPREMEDPRNFVDIYGRCSSLFG